MSWTYIEPDHEGDRGEQPIPPRNTIYRGFDAFRWRQVVCMTENTVGCISILNPNVDDDCQIIAYAPLDEATQPDEARLRQIWPDGPIYGKDESPSLWLSEA